MMKKALLLMAVAEGVSLLAYNFPVLSLPLLILSAIAVFVLSWKNLEWGIYILFAELFFGSRGHLLEYDLGFASISLRLVIFAAVFVVWLIQNSKFKIQNYNSKSKILYGLLLAVIGFGIFNGVWTHAYGLKNVFNDANGYLYLLILPAVLSAIKTRAQVENLLQILAAAILVIAAKTFLLFLWFTLDLPGVAAAYHWVVSQDFGEITGDVGSASRIFMQSQFYALVGLFIFGLAERKNWLVIAAAILSVLMSLSRSFWLGAISGGLFALVAMLWHFRLNLRQILALGLKLGLIAVLEIGLLYGLVAIAGGAVADAVSSRGGNPATEAAGGARLLLLPKLIDAIKQEPITGAGFGKQVTYKSYLPDRVTAKNPDGEITSYAFEWGYLDTALKVGIVGLFIYLFFIAGIFERGWRAVQVQNAKFKMQSFGVLAGLVALLILNVTTPYLNHPLGIGYLILSFVIFNSDYSDVNS